jgi:hypothetical protein
MPSLITDGSEPNAFYHASQPNGGTNVVASSDSNPVSFFSRKRKAQFHISQPVSAHILQRMLKEEQIGRSSRDFRALLETSASTNYTNVVVLNHLWRERVAKWFYDVVDYLEESREVAYVAMNFLNRYLAVLFQERHLRTVDMQPMEFQVVATTSLFLAIRVCGVNKELQIPELLQLSSSRATKTNHILEAGHHMLKKLSWTHRIVTPHAFLKEYLALLVVSHSSVKNNSNNLTQNPKVGPSQEQVMSLLDFACYLIEVSVCDAYFNTVAPSQVALGALAVAMTCDGALSSHRTFLVSLFRTEDEFSSIDLESAPMKQIMSRLVDIYSQSHDSKVSLSSTSRKINIDDNENSPHSHTENHGCRRSDTTSKLVPSPHLIIDDDDVDEVERDTMTMDSPMPATTVIAMGDLRCVSLLSSIDLIQE